MDRGDMIGKALRAFQAGNADFADCLNERISHAAGCGATVTFDVQASRTAGMSLVA